MMADPVLVIGGDTNGLTAACALARNGRQVTLLTHGPLGGLASRHEFHPGYHSPGVLTDTTALRRFVVASLELERHGLRYDDSASVLVLGPDGHLEISNDPEATATSIERRCQPDAANYRRFLEFIDTVRPALARIFDSPPADLVDPSLTDLGGLLSQGFHLRRLGKKAMLEVLRIAPMAVYDWLEEWFEDPLLKAALALPAVVESYTAPWSAGTNANLLIREVTRGNDVVGDGLALTDALERAARDYGVTIQDRFVTRIDPGSVTTDDGEKISSGTIFTSLDPRTVFLDLVRPELLEHRFEQRVLNFRARGLRSQLLLALDRPLAPSLPSSARHVRITSDLDAIERSFDPIKYGEFSEAPTLEMYRASEAHPDLAPNGHAVVSVTIHYTPYQITGSWSDEARERLVRTVIGQLTRHFPELTDHIVGHQLLTPPDLEQRYRVHGGHVFQGEHALDQLLVRPTPECSQYATPIAGLYLCGGGSFPGGGLTCAPGALAARTLR